MTFSSTAPAHPHATRAAVYPALFSLTEAGKFCDTFFPGVRRKKIAAAKWKESSPRRPRREIRQNRKVVTKKYFIPCTQRQTNKTKQKTWDVCYRRKKGAPTDTDADNIN